MKKVLLLFVVILSSLIGLGQSVSIGDILCTDGSTVKPEQFAASGKTAEGIVFHVDANDAHGWAVALYDQASSINWSSSGFYGYDITELPNYENARVAIHDLNGYHNTDIIRNQGFPSDFPAAWAVDFDNGWYLPSAGQLRYLFSNFPEINASLQIVGGTTIPYWLNKYYWSSTEFTSYHAYDMNSGGSLGDYVKDNHVNYPPNGIAVRQIRDFNIPNPSHPMYHVGDIITNNDGSQGILFYVNPDQTDGWIVALDDASPYAQWGNNGNVPGLTDQTCSSPYGILLDETDGYGNTGHIRNHETNPNIAANLVDYEHGWYLPTAGQLAKLFGSLAFIEDKLQVYGNTLAKDNYWSSSEANAGEAFALSCNPSANVRAGHFLRYNKSDHCRVRAIRNLVFEETAPTVGNINAPEPICTNESLFLQIPESQHAISQGWQLSPTADFNETFTYTGEPLTLDHNGWYLRYYVSNPIGTAYSNSVSISVFPTYTSVFNITTCSDYTWNGITYTQPGVYEQTLSTIHGCDSVVTLNLSFDSINKREVFLSDCDEIVFNGITYTQSGNYQQIIPANVGCDTIVELHLNIRHSPLVSQIHGESLIYFQTSGTYTYSIDPVEGCFGYEWCLDGPWSLTSSHDSPECTITMNAAGVGKLKVRVYTECGYIERTLFINHDVRPDVIIFPNPTYGEFNIILRGMQGKAVIVIYDSLGQCINRYSVDTNVEDMVVPCSLKGHAAGVYFVVVHNGLHTISKKVVKDKPATHVIYNW